MVLVRLILLGLLIAAPFLKLDAKPIEPRIHNIATNFLEFWDSAKGLTLDERVKIFDQTVVSKFPQFYQFVYQSWKSQNLNKVDRLNDFFKNFMFIEKEFRNRHEIINRDLKKTLKSFQKKFSDFNSDFDLYIVHSLGQMDGGMRVLGDKNYFIFGIDGIVKYHNGTSDTPFFHHELFHLYHSKYFRFNGKLWESLWGEGLATYVSEVLNRGSSFKNLMLDTPAGLVPKSQAKIRVILQDLLDQLDSTDKEIYKTYFLMNSLNKEIPKRAGYYVGYLIAKELGKSYSLKELSRLSGEPLKKLIQKSLKDLIELDQFRKAIVLE